jgi:hypothetical protein
MATRTCAWLLAGLVIMSSAGCARYAIRGKGGVYEQVYEGSLRINGNDNELTLLTGSDVPKLSIFGRDNRVIFNDGATVSKIEIAGADNAVTYPKGLKFKYSEIGKDNKLIERP